MWRSELEWTNDMEMIRMMKLEVRWDAGRTKKSNSAYLVVAALLALGAVVALRLLAIENVTLESVFDSNKVFRWVAIDGATESVCFRLARRSTCRTVLVVAAVVRCTEAKGSRVVADQGVLVAGATVAAMPFSRSCKRVKLDVDSRCRTLASDPLLGAGWMPNMWQNIEYKLTVSNGAVLNCCLKSGPWA